MANSFMLAVSIMKLRTFQLGLKILLLIGFAPLLRGETVLWVFEGRIWQMDPQLEAVYGADAVFSGSLQTALFEPYATGDLVDGESFEGGVSGAELTLDRNHRVLAQAFQGESWPIVDLRPGEDTDALVFIVPLRTTIAEDEWQLVWLEIGLHGDAGALLPGGADWPDWQAGLDWEWAWFRLSFVASDSDERALIEGGLDLFAASAEELDLETELERFRLLVADLATEVDDRDLQIVELEAELADAHERIAGLNRTLDRVWEEQDRLRAERDRLEEVKPLGDEEAWQQRLAEKEAEIALLDEAHRNLQEDFELLQYAYQDADTERRRLRTETEGLRDALEQERLVRLASERHRDVGFVPDSYTPEENPNFRIVEHPLQLRPVGSAGDSEPMRLEAEARPSVVEPEVDALESDGMRSALQRRRGPRSR